MDVAGLGQCCLDTLLLVDAYPPADAKCEYRERLEQGGGPVATGLVALRRWGASCAILGVVGDDDAGSRIRASLEEEGVDTRGLRVREGGSSQLATIVAEAGTGRRTVFWKRPSGPPLEPREVDLDAVRHARLLYTDGLFARAALAACRAAAEVGVPVLVDAGSLREGMLDLVPLSHAYLASEKFARELTGGDRPLEACRELAARGAKVAGVTLGDRGYVAVVGGRVIEGPAVAVDAVDTTGCGDVFHAGFGHGLLSGWTPASSLRFAAWAASRVAARLGGRSGIPDAGEFPEAPEFT